jgi:V/A-type H+-transporting ATPase subunit B
VFVENVFSARIGEAVIVNTPDGRELEAEVLEIDGNTVMVEVYGSTQGLDIERTSVVFTDAIKKVPLSSDIVGRIFNGSFVPKDGIPMFIPEKWKPITGAPMNPSARARPRIHRDRVLNHRWSEYPRPGQKLPVFSASGLPSKEVVGSILKNARLADSAKRFIVVFAALGLTFHEYSHYLKVLEEMKTGFVAFVNMADEPVMERILAPRFALTVAEYLAFEKGMDILVIITDMTNYCDALREISTAREELPGRRGYPGYMYSDLASLYERAGRVYGLEGSVTMLPVLTMPEDDITHPIPDLTGYITEGQIVLSRELHQKGIFPPIDVLPSLSRLMQKGIGEGRTRADHRKVSNHLYKYYAKGRDLRRLEAIVGRDGMTKSDILMLDFADAFEKDFVGQGMARRTVFETLDAGLDLMKKFSLEVK